MITLIYWQAELETRVCRYMSPCRICLCRDLNSPSIWVSVSMLKVFLQYLAITMHSFLYFYAWFCRAKDLARRRLLSWVWGWGLCRTYPARKNCMISNMCSLDLSLELLICPPCCLREISSTGWLSSQTQISGSLNLMVLPRSASEATLAIAFRQYSCTSLEQPSELGSCNQGSLSFMASCLPIFWHMQQVQPSLLSSCLIRLELLYQQPSMCIMYKLQLAIAMNVTQEFPGFLSVLSSFKNEPIEQVLGKWESKVHNGHIKRLTDPDIQLPVIEISGTNIMKNYIALPASPGSSLRIKMPVLVLLVKNLDKYFRFEVDILDSKNIKRTFISCNKQSITRIKPFECSMPLELDDGWNEITFNLEEYCDKAFGTQFLECQRLQINANCRIARLYFNDKVKTEDEIPPEYKLFMRVQAYKP